MLPILALAAAFSATVTTTTVPGRNVPEGRLFVRDGKARVEQGPVTVIWDGKKLWLKAKGKKPAALNPDQRPAFGIPPSCLETCGWEPKGEDPIAGKPEKVFEKLFAKTSMGPLRQRVWIDADGVPRRIETRSARGVTRMDLSAIQTTPPPSDALFTSSR